MFGELPIGLAFAVCFLFNGPISGLSGIVVRLARPVRGSSVVDVGHHVRPGSWSSSKEACA